MKIHSHLFDCLNITHGAVNVIDFSSDKHQLLFRQQLREWRSVKDLKEGFCHITLDGIDMTNKDLDILEIVGGTTDFLNIKHLHQWVQYIFENDENFIGLFSELKRGIEDTFHQIVIPLRDMQVEFDVKEVLVENLLKNVDIIISNDNDFLTILDYRKILVELWLSMGKNGRNKVILYYSPEGDFSTSGIRELFSYLENLPITVVCFTKSETFIMGIPSKQIQLVKENRTIYPIQDLKLELQAFDLTDENLSLDEVAKILARRDFYNEILLLDKKWVSFLKSNKY